MQNTSQVIIQGKTVDGKIFRPSDWAERLSGVMCQFRPLDSRTIDGHVGFSPWCVPTSIDGIKCVLLHTDLKHHHPQAWHYAINFALENKLTIID